MPSSVPMSGFIRFINASQARRRSTATVLRAQADASYAPGADFWLPVRRAIATDRRTTRDGRALEAVLANASSKRRPSYARAVGKWGAIAPRWKHTQPVQFDRTSLLLGGLPIAVAPNFAEGDGSGVEIVYVWLNKAPLSPEAIVAAQWMLLRAHPGYVPVVVDLQRGAVHVESPVALRAAADEVAAQAADLARLLSEAA